jgi:hypothetical protein
MHRFGSGTVLAVLVLLCAAAAGAGCSGLLPLGLFGRANPIIRRHDMTELGPPSRLQIERRASAAFLRGDPGYTNPLFFRTRSGPGKVGVLELDSLRFEVLPAAVWEEERFTRNDCGMQGWQSDRIDADYRMGQLIVDGSPLPLIGRVLEFRLDCAQRFVAVESFWGFVGRGPSMMGPATMFLGWRYLEVFSIDSRKRIGRAIRRGFRRGTDSSIDVLDPGFLRPRVHE